MNTLPEKSNVKKHLGFTLIELIVVITILTILGAIGFVSSTGYFASSRDSVRLTDMNNIYEQLWAARVNNGGYPLPDNYRTVALSGVNVAYQGYAGKTVLSAIKFEKGGRDPKDSTYYTYAVGTKLSKAQVMGYFEEYDTGKLANITSLFPEASAASTIDYTSRKIGVIGKKVCILVESGTLAPVQDSSTGTLDIATTSSGYTVYCDNVIAASGTGGILATTFINNSVAYTPPNTCATNPSFANLWTLTTGTPASIGQNWTYSATPGSCTYTCACGYGGTGCNAVVFPDICNNTQPSSCQSITSAQATANQASIYASIANYIGCKINDYPGGSGAIAGTGVSSKVLVASQTNDSASNSWSDGNAPTAGTSSTVDGSGNTTAMIADAVRIHAAAITCRAKGSNWYLPASTEISAFYLNRVAINFPSLNSWSSTDDTTIFGYYLSSGGTLLTAAKTDTFAVRCASRF